MGIIPRRKSQIRGKMAVAMLLEWPGETEQQYECLMDLAALEKDPPEGGSSRRRAHARGLAGAGYLGIRRGIRAVQSLGLGDVHHPRKPELVGAHAERVAPHLLFEGHLNVPAGRQLVPVAAESVGVVAAHADRHVVAGLDLHPRGGDPMPSA